MKSITSLIVALIFTSCTAMKLSIPDTFKKQATNWRVQGARKNKMVVGDYSTSRIKRGLHIMSSGENGHFLENLLLSPAGVQKQEHVSTDKARFRYTISDQKNTADISGQEKETSRSIGYHAMNSNSILNGLTQTQQHEYIFSAEIRTRGADSTGNWQLVMSNEYAWQIDSVKSLFKYVPSDDNGTATNGKDTIFIKSVSVRNMEGANGKQGRFPIRMLSGYELSTADGVMAIIDLIDKSVWMYNELEQKDRFITTIITTALFARKVNDTKW